MYILIPCILLELVIMIDTYPYFQLVPKYPKTFPPIPINWIIMG